MPCSTNAVSNLIRRTAVLVTTLMLLAGVALAHAFMAHYSSDEFLLEKKPHLHGTLAGAIAVLTENSSGSCEELPTSHLMSPRNDLASKIHSADLYTLGASPNSYVLCLVSACDFASDL